MSKEKSKKESSSMKGKIATFVLGCLVGSMQRDLMQSLDAYKSAMIIPSTRLSDTAVVDDRDRQLRFQKYNDTYKYHRPMEPRRNSTDECGIGPDFPQFFQLGKRSRSRFNEDKIIYETFFKGRLNGDETFVELGAFNGMDESNSRFYDECLAWKGLLIEGNPGNYKGVVHSRQNAHRMSFAPSCSAEYEATNKTVQFYVHTLLNSGLPGAAKTYEGRATVDVPCGPLTPVLQDVFGKRGVAFFSLDVEGSEKLVLETIDFKAVQIDVLMIEVENTHCPANQHCQVRDQVREHMARAGYILHKGLVRASDVYVHPESPFQKQR